MLLENFEEIEKKLIKEMNKMEKNFKKENNRKFKGIEYEKKKLKTLKMFITIVKEIEKKTISNYEYKLKIKKIKNDLKGKIKSFLNYIENCNLNDIIKIKKIKYK